MCNTGPSLALRSWLICTPSPACCPALLRSARLATLQREEGKERKGKPQGAIQHPLGVLSHWVGVLWSSSNKQRCVCQQRFPKELRRSKRAGIPTCGPPLFLLPLFLLLLLLLLLLHSHLPLPSARRAGRFLEEWKFTEEWQPFQSCSIKHYGSSSSSSSSSSNVFKDVIWLKRETCRGRAPAYSCFLLTSSKTDNTHTHTHTHTQRFLLTVVSLEKLWTAKHTGESWVWKRRGKIKFPEYNHTHSEVCVSVQRQGLSELSGKKTQLYSFTIKMGGAVMPRGSWKSYSQITHLSKLIGKQIET